MWFFSSIISGKYRRTVNTLKHCLLCESVFAFIPSLLFASTSLWPWQEVHHCEGSVQKKKKGKNTPRWGEMSGLNEMRVIGSDTWSERLSFFAGEATCAYESSLLLGWSCFFSPCAERNERTQQRSSQKRRFTTDFLHLTATGGTCARSADASTLLPSWSLFFWAHGHTTFPLSVLYSLSE